MLEGHLLNERYLIKHSIGGGGMANVYSAHDLILDRDVAIKVLRLEFADDDEFIERFDREAQAATSLSHPNVVNIYDVGEQDNIMYIVMELVEGLTLKEYIQEKGPLEVKEAIEIMKKITQAINHAHENDLIHRDIKPQNILIDNDGTVKVTDFGIAIALSATSLTQTNSILGSVHYLSPEQARGGMATRKSDIYSLGIVFFELLTGNLPFVGESAISVALKHLQNETPSVRAFNPLIPQSVENIVLRSTDKNPLHRYDSVSEFEEALETSLTPKMQNAPRYLPPVEVGEETRAMPLFTHYPNSEDINDTLVPNTNEMTKKLEPIKEEPKKEVKKKKSKKKALVIGSILALIIISIIIFLIIFKPKDVVIPDLVGMEYDEAVEELEDINLKVKKELINSEDIDEGLIVKTNPRSSRTIKEKSVVTLFVSEGGEKVEFKDFVGKRMSQIKRILEEDGYSDVIEYEKASDKEVGTIINQIQPKAGSLVVPSETTVIFEVSKGRDTIVLEDFTGKNKEDFKGYADKHGLILNILKEYSDTIKEGHIIRQSPGVGANIYVGSTVSMTVSKGKKEIESKSHAVTFTVPFLPLEDEKEQKVVIYVDDLENSITSKFKEVIITKDEEFTINLLIEKDKNAQYKVVRDEKVIMQKTIPYKVGK